MIIGSGKLVSQPQLIHSWNTWSIMRRHLVMRIVGATIILALLALIMAAPAASHDSDQSSARNQTASSFTSHSQLPTGYSSSNLSLTVNGQAIDVPDNGSTQQTITNSDGSQTSVSVSHSHSGGSSNSSISSVTQSVTNSDASVHSQVDQSFSLP